MPQPPAPPSFGARPRPRRILSVIKSGSDNGSTSDDTGTGAETGVPVLGPAPNSSNPVQVSSFRPPISAVRPTSVTLSSPVKRSPSSTPPPPSFSDNIDVVPKAGFTQLGATIEHALNASHNSHRHDESQRLSPTEHAAQAFGKRESPLFNEEHRPRFEQSQFIPGAHAALSFESQAIAAEAPPASFPQSAQLDGLHRQPANFSTDRAFSSDRQSPGPLSPKSSGEVFLDAADKAADFIGDRLKDTFKMFTSSPSMSLSPKSQSPVSDADPFADILSNLKDPRPKSPAVLSSNSDRDVREELSKLSIHPTGLNAALLSDSPKTSDALLKNDNLAPLEDNAKSPVLQGNDSLSPKSGSVPSLKGGDISSLKDSDIPSLKGDDIPSFPANQPTLKPSNIFRHGLSALERIGKTTADVVVGTRNKIIEQASIADGQQPPLSPSNPVVPDFTDASQSFTQVFQLYGGLAKLQATQIKSIRSGIALKFAMEKASKTTAVRSSYDFNWRHGQCPKVSLVLHPDHIGTLARKLTHLDTAKDEILEALPGLQDDIVCLFGLLRSLENIFVEAGSAEELIASNRRRHTLCQLASISNDIVNALPTTLSIRPEDVEPTATALSQLAAVLLRSLQDNFGRNCSDEAAIANGDQQIVHKMILDMTYAIVPQLQSRLFA